VKALILCGGMGTRLREETEVRPKPMVNVGPRPILWHIMKTYAHYGHKEFVLCLGYKGDVIKRYFLDYETMNADFTITLGRKESIELHSAHGEQDWKVTLAHTGLNAMTGARVKRAQSYVGSERFMLTYGDGLSDVDLGSLVRFHESHGKIGTVTGVAPPGRFGELSLEEDHVRSFREKPHASTAYINGGFFVLESEFFDYVSPRDDCVLERDPLESLARDGQLMVYRHHGFWQCMDTYRDLELLRGLWESGTPPWRVW
jgi:glucose-1-phosphate cytidylyltransferase